jgi:drug/metabolite transporter (DMT)-like permease
MHMPIAHYFGFCLRGAVVRKPFSPHLFAVLQALFVTFLWSTSWVLIKIGLDEIPALTFAGLRYILAFLCLLPLALARPAQRQALRDLSSQEWRWLVVLGIVGYSLTQGAQFLGLAYLPALTVSLLLSFTPVLVALLGIPLLAERLSRPQWFGLGLFVVGVVLYFYPISLAAGQGVGLAIMAVGVFANASGSILSRSINRAAFISPLLITVVSMGVGSIVLLAAGILFQGLPRLALVHWLLIAWLAVVNTAFAFTLWNHTLRTLSAVESSLINSAMLIQIAILAWLFLGERLTLREGIGVVFVGLSVVIVQLYRRA